VKNFDYKLFLENGTILDINEDIFADVYSPLTDLFLANYNYSVYFAKQGYDIYNKSGDFYNDKCSPAYLYENDITLSDRKSDIYPNGVTLCKDNCEYKSFNIEEKRILCDCNLNLNNNYTKKNDSFLEEKEDKGNFFNYFLDNINYKIFKCYNLITSFETLKNNIAFYSAIIVLSVVLLINAIFWLHGISRIRKIMSKQIPTFQKVYNDYMKEILRNKRDSSEALLNPPKKQYKKKKSKTFRKKRNTLKRKTHKTLTLKHHLDLIDSSKNNIELNKVNLHEKRTIKIDEQTKENIKFNELPFSQAVKLDKRNIISIFISVIVEKLELVNLIFGGHKIIIVLIYQYILSLLSIKYCLHHLYHYIFLYL
jgi:hypothetical protein